MAQDDYAILVGISRYPSPGFATLSGPANDLSLMRDWLMSPAGGAIPAARIRTIDHTPFPPETDAFKARPSSADFEAEYLQLERARMALKTARVNGRLYLYFSGHGFCGREINRDAEAALYAANAAKDYYPHIYGTYFARRAKAKALFAEIVLIMDCCRDSEVNRMPIQPSLPNTPDDDVSAEVRVFAIYAVPKGGKAHERVIVERGGNTHGLLTHALIKTLEDARPTGDGQISATRLRDHLLQSWDAVCGADAAHRPDFYPPGTEMYFAAKNHGIRVEFTFGAPQPADTQLILRNGKLKKIAQLSASGNPDDDVIGENGPILKLERNGAAISLRMLPGFYEYEIAGTSNRKDKFKVEAGDVSIGL